MASDRKQINVRVDDDVLARAERVRRAASESHGLQLSLSDLFRMGLVELERKYAGEKRKR